MLHSTQLIERNRFWLIRYLVNLLFFVEDENSCILFFIVDNLLRAIRWFSPTFHVTAKPNAPSAGRFASVEKYEPTCKPLRHRRQYVDRNRQENILLGDVERAERHSVHRLRSGHARVAEGILFGTYNRVYRQPTQGNYRQRSFTYQQATRRYFIDLPL